MLLTSGLTPPTETTMAAWYKALCTRVSDQLFLASCEELMVFHPKFWPSDNVIGLVMEKARELAPTLASRRLVDRDMKMVSGAEPELMDPEVVKQFVSDFCSGKKK